MGDFDKEIKQAKEIGQGWIKTSEDYYAKLQSLKKGKLTDIKDEISSIQKAAETGHDLISQEITEELEYRLDKAEKDLKACATEGGKIFDAHDSWALKEPRHNMRPIGTKLGLGSPTDKKYVAVAAGCKSMLSEVAQALSNVDRLWKEDIKFQITTQEKRIESQRKILNGIQSEAQSYTDQLKKSAKAFTDQCAQVFTELKVQGDSLYLFPAQNGTLDPKKESSWVQSPALFRKKLAAIPSILALMDKNYKRMEKSVPSEHFETFLKSKDGKELDAAWTKLKNQLKQATTLYTKLLEAFEKSGYK